MKKTSILFLLLALLLLAGCGGDEVDLRNSITKNVAFHTTKIKAEPLVEGGDENWFLDLFGSREIYIPVVVNYKSVIYGKDIKDISIDNINKCVELTLPEPIFIVDNNEIDWDNVVRNVGKLRRDFTKKEIDALYQKALEKSNEEFKTPKREYIDLAYKNAEISFTQLIESFGYKAKIKY